MTAALATRGLTKCYGRLTAVDTLDLEVAEGDLFGFLGPNGSGKTTTVRMLLGLVFATSGSVEVLGRAVPGRGAPLRDVGALVEGPAYYGHVSGRTNLALVDAAGPGGARRTRRARVADALDRVGLGAVDDRPVRNYSLGMKQRLGLAAALLRRPRLLILDEPTNGLDPHGIREVRDLLAELNADGVTVFLSSHLLAEVEQVCTRAAIVSEGRLVAQDRVDVLLAPTGRVFVVTQDVAAAVAVEPRAERVDNGVVVTLPVGPTGVVASAELATRLVSAGVRVDELVVERPTLEQVFLAVTGSGSDLPAGLRADRR